jgi:hypothetical protein
MTDSITSEGWLKKTNFIKDREEPTQATICLEVAHFHTSQHLLHGIREYSQWFCGTGNTVTNALSRDNDWSDEELTRILCSHCPSQVPKHFKILPLPSKITSWLTFLLLWMPVKPQLVEAHTRTTLGCGIATLNTATALDSEATTSSTECTDNTELKSWELLPWLCIKGNFCNRVMVPWLKAQSQVPSTLWLWPSGKTDKKIPTMMQSATLANFYNGN